MKPKFFIFYILLSFIFNQYSTGQDKNIYIESQKTTWDVFSKSIEDQYNVRFFYYRDSIPNIDIVVNNDSTSLVQALTENFTKYNVQVSYDGIGNYFLFKNFSLTTNVENIFESSKRSSRFVSDVEYATADDEYLKTYQDFMSESVVIGTNGNGHKNGKVKLSGYVTNLSDGSTIPQARLKINETNTNIITNIDGYYEVLLKPGEYTLSANSLGMYEKNFKLLVNSSGKLNIPLKTKSFLLEEAVVSANRNHNVRSTSMGFEKISAKAIKELPVVLGEQDIVKVALLLPGVQTIGEVSSGFNVRGSPADQNMFYINELPIYNSSHLFGLYTTFNAEAIEEFDFYKNNIPIEYGGHLSSIFNIKAKKGKTDKFSARGGIGPLSSRVLVEGPILKDSSSSYLISFRSTYSDWLLNQVDNFDIKNSKASFYDALINLSTRINTQNNIELFVYGSDDHSDLAFGIKNKYTNMGASINWSHIFSKKLVSDLSIVKSQYSYNIESYEIAYK
ncbi:carboxypeptidase-like regulatory domain-containing protein, partial [Bacteroidota bacterium]